MVNDTDHVLGHGGEVVSLGGLGALAVTPLIQGDHCVVLGQDRRDHVPDMTAGSQAMKQHHRLPGPAPVPVVEVQPVGCHPFFARGLCHLSNLD